MTKDLFSTQASDYARYRPVYPEELYDFIYSQVRNFDRAWDCGTGNGQVARVLAEKFREVIATDISDTQLNLTFKAPNIIYKKTEEEIKEMPDHVFDLITVGTAIHWFDFDKFYTEVRRTGKQGGIIAVWCYSLMHVNPEIDNLLNDFCYKELGPYWDKERKWVDDEYRNIPFPFDEIETPIFSIKSNWSLQQLKGYLNSWSSLQHYLKTHGTNPVEGFIEKMRPLWIGSMPVEFPLPVRIGKISL